MAEGRLNMPDEVKEATDGYRQEMDTFSSFIEECCIVEEGRKVSNRSIRYAYETWCRENGDYPLGQKLFNAKRHSPFPYGNFILASTLPYWTENNPSVFILEDV